MALRPHVILHEDDPVLARILSDLFADEGIGLTLCGSLAEIEQALDQQPDAVVVTDTWADATLTRWAAADDDRLSRLAARVRVIVTTSSRCGAPPAGLDRADALVPLPKPFDLDELLSAVRAGAELSAV